MIKKLGRFEILKEIAEGGMAKIYVARQRGFEGFEKLVVCKVLLPDLAKDSKFVQLFLNEARIASRLNHPNVVQIYDLGNDRDDYYIAMEFIHGESLYALAKACRKKKRLVPLKYTLRVASQVCEGLHYAHTKADVKGQSLNIVHCDVSPQNILVSYEGIVKVVDFGIAKAASVIQETHPGQVKGKLIYMAPEQVRDSALDGRTDVFAMGIVLFELVTGYRLFKRKTKAQTIRALVDEPIPSAVHYNPKVPPEVDAILQKALQREPAQRFQSTLEMGQSLEAYAHQSNLALGTFELSEFMGKMFPDRLELLRRIAEVQATGRNLEAMLFDDLNLDKDGFMGSVAGEVSGEISGTTGLSSSLSTFTTAHTPPPVVDDDKIVFRAMRPRRRVWPWVAVVVLVAALAVAGVLFYPTIMRWLQGDDASGGKADAPMVTNGSSLRVTSTPVGARVAIDGKRRGVTPVDLSDLAPGTTAVVRVTKPGYRPFVKRVQVDAEGRVEPVHARLTRPVAVKFGRIRVVTDPPGATLFLNGKRVPGQTPLEVPRVAVGQVHDLAASMPGRRTWSTDFVVPPGETLELKGTLPPATDGERALLSIDSSPKAEVFVSGRKLGVTPLTETPIPAGWHEIRLVNHHLGSVETLTLEAKAGDSIMKTVEFKKGILKVEAQPWANVYHLDKKIGTTPLEKELYKGRYDLVLKNPSLNLTHRQQVEIKAGQTAEVSINMQGT